MSHSIEGAREHSSDSAHDNESQNTGTVQEDLLSLPARSEPLTHSLLRLNREHLETLACVVEQKSFDRAANKLYISRGAVSQRIRALEDTLELTLLIREKPVLPTRAGKVLLNHVQSLRMLESATLRQLRRDAAPLLPLSVSIAVDGDSLATWFSKVLPSLLVEGQLTVAVVTDSQDEVQLLKRGDLMGRVTTESESRAGSLVEFLGEMEFQCIASRAFAQQYFPQGLSALCIRSAPAIVSSHNTGVLHDRFLRLNLGFHIERYMKHCIPDSQARKQAIASGCGYGLLPSESALSMIASSAAVDLAPSNPIRIPMYWHHAESECLALRKISDLFVEIARHTLSVSIAATTNHVKTEPVSASQIRI